MSYKGKVVVVTGAGRGLGSSIAETYASKGAKVVLAEKELRLGLETEKRILDAGGIATFIQTDVSRPAAILELFTRTTERYEKVDILINNAGISKWKSPYEITVDEWDEIINTNLRSAFLCAREAARIMRTRGGGSIVNIGSTRAYMSEPDSEAYAASKGGIVSLTHALAASFSPDHIQVNCISPGWIETGDYNQLNEADHNQHLSGRVGLPRDIVNACLYLTDGGNNFINGTNITIDGGMTRKMIYK